MESRFAIRGLMKRSNNRMHYNGRNSMPTRGYQGTSTKPYLSFHDLDTWGDKDSYVISKQLIGQNKGFEDLMRSSAISGDKIIILVKIFAKICSLHDSNETKKVVDTILSYGFIYKLQEYLWDLQLQDDHDSRNNKYFWRDPETFFHNLSIVFDAVLETGLKSASKALPKAVKAVLAIIAHLETTRAIQVSNRIAKKFGEIQEKLMYFQISSEIPNSQLDCASDLQPVENFRQLSIYPCSQDVLPNDVICPRKHVIDGAYENCDHYLDVQFRLLREDFITDLRSKFGRFVNMKDYTSVYPHVELIGRRFVDDQQGALVQFNFSENHWQRPTFLKGSLLCFTRNNFDTLFFATVVDQSIQLLEKQQVIVRFEPVCNDYKLFTPYLMVDVCVDFKCLYVVLTALQSLNKESFPMEKYIIRIDTKLESPVYLNHKSIYRIGGSSVPLFVSRAWPSASQLGFDDYQLSAFKAALTESFSITRGVSGTGKTFVAIQTIKTLIENKDHWHMEDNHTPLLILTNTRSALDQLLEGLVGYSDKVVRLCTTNNENLPNFNLDAKRKWLVKKPIPNINRRLILIRCDFEAQLERLKNWNNVCDMLQDYEGVLNFQHIGKLAFDYDNSWFKNASDALIIDWLLGTEKCNKTPLVATGREWVGQIKMGGDYNGNVSIASTDYGFGIKFKFGKLGSKEQPTYLMSLVRMKQYAKSIESELEARNVAGAVAVRMMSELENGLRELQKDIDYLEMRLNEGKVSSKSGKSSNILKITDINLKCPYQMTPENRWKLYFYWFDLYKISMNKKVEHLHTQYLQKYEQYLTLKHDDDMQILRQMLVVGTTVEDATIHYNIIKELQSRIVLVDQASEILESHLIVLLTNQCQHLILLGDDAKKPKIISDKMVDYNLDVSLVKRMIQNKLPHHALKIQHKAHRELCDLFLDESNFIYHGEVRNLPPIYGVEKSLYFINVVVPDLAIENMYANKFLIAFAKYLVLTGHCTKDITILTLLPDQLQALLLERSTNKILKDVLITAPYNFHGLHSKIILANLIGCEKDVTGYVINNNFHAIMSGAKEGLYMFGNMDSLCKENKVWVNIKENLHAKGYLVSSIPLRCKIHKEITTYVQSVEDFNEIFETGCKSVCGVELLCGHKCTEICHLGNRHDMPSCGHQHNLVFNQKCTACYENLALLSSSSTSTKVPNTYSISKKSYVDKEVRECGHMVKTKCSEVPLKNNCKERCTMLLKCGHNCQNKCNQPCTTKCLLLVNHTKTVDCGHQFKIPCYLANSDVSSYDYELLRSCNEPCRSKLECGHICTGTCANCLQSRIHQSCKQKCLIVLPCGHNCSRPCSQPCFPCIQPYRCTHKIHQIYKKQCGSSYAKCKQPCKRTCLHAQCTTMCGQKCAVPPCNSPCTKKLKCTHTCLGFCGEPCPPVCITCNPLTDVFSDSKLTSSSRFVVLQDCNHVIHDETMQNWLMKCERMVASKSCPKCKTPVLLTLRYREYTENLLQDIKSVEEKYYINSRNVHAMRSDLLNRLQDLCTIIPKLIPASTKEVNQLLKLKASINAINPTNKLSQNYYKVCFNTIKIEILESIIKMLQVGKLKQSEFYGQMSTYIKFLLESLLSTKLQLATQTISDFKREIQRLNRIIQLGEMKDCDKLKKIPIETYKKLQKLVFRATVYEQDCDNEIYQELLKFGKLVNVSYTNMPKELFKITSAEDVIRFRWAKCENGHFYQSSLQCTECCDK